MDTIRERHWNTLSKKYSTTPKNSFFRRSYRKVLAHYYDKWLPQEGSILDIGCGDGLLLSELTKKNTRNAGQRNFEGMDLSETMLAAAKEKCPEATLHMDNAETHVFQKKYQAIILSDTLNETFDVQGLLQNIVDGLQDGGRLVVNIHNTLWRPLLGLAAFLRLIPKRSKQNWLSVDDVENLLDLAGWETIRREPRILIPLPMGGIGTWINRIFSPLLPWFCLSIFLVARPYPKQSSYPKDNYSVSVIVPARNEEGNIENVLRRTPRMGLWTEIIFVEGGSSDDTWEEIRKAEESPPEGLRVRGFQQEGKGKGDAMRKGYAHAEGDIIIILDADLTVPPEDLGKFHECLASGKAEFVNGVRLVYPMEEEAMRFLNMCGNKFFSIAFSKVLGFSIKDTLCGTKAFWRKDYQEIARWRDTFGDIDPFGDFDLIFAARAMNLKIRDLPIRYQSREYGETQIHRWKDGWRLFKMVFFAARKFTFN